MVFSAGYFSAAFGTDDLIKGALKLVFSFLEGPVAVADPGRLRGMLMFDRFS